MNATPKDAREIRASSDTHTNLGRRYGVSRVAIRYIRNRMNWGHI